MLLTLQTNSKALPVTSSTVMYADTWRLSSLRGDGHGKRAKTTTRHLDQKQIPVEILLVSWEAGTYDNIRSVMLLEHQWLIVSYSIRYTDHVHGGHDRHQNP